MKKVVALVLALGMTTLLFASCNGNSDDTTTTNTIGETTTTSTDSSTTGGSTETTATTTQTTTTVKEPISFADEDMVDSITYGYYCKVLRDETVKNTREALYDKTILNVINGDFASKSLKSAAENWVDTYNNSSKNAAAAKAYIEELEKSDNAICQEILAQKDYLSYDILATAEIIGLAVSGWKTEDATANIVIEAEYTARDSAGNPTTLPVLQIGVGQGVVNFQTMLETVSIPVGVTKIANNAFSQCSNLKSVELPEGLTSIGKMAFWHCTSLESIVIPDSVTEIGKYAFSDCTSLKSVTLPERFRDQASNLFDGCPNVVITYTN